MHCGASIGICQGGGAGKYLAQWMVHGQAEINMREFDPRRFGNWASKDYTAEVSVADYHHMYYCYKPAEQHEVGRDLRKSALLRQAESRGAQFSQIFGWERAALVRHERQGRGISPSSARTGGSAVREEALAVRERVGPDGSLDLRQVRRDRHGCLMPSSIASAPTGFPAKDGGIILGHLLNANGFIEIRNDDHAPGAGALLCALRRRGQLYDMDQLNWRKRAGRAT